MQNLDRRVLNNQSYFFYMHITSVHRGQGKVEIQSQLAAHLPHACPFLITGISTKVHTHLQSFCSELHFWCFSTFSLQNREITNIMVGSKSGKDEANPVYLIPAWNALLCPTRKAFVLAI